MWQNQGYLATTKWYINFRGLDLRKKHDIHNWASALETSRGLLYCVINFGPQTV